MNPPTPSSAPRPGASAPRPEQREVHEHPILILAWIACAGMLAWGIPERSWPMTVAASAGTAAFAFLLIRVFVVGYTGYERLLGLRIIRRENALEWSGRAIVLLAVLMALGIGGVFAFGELRGAATEAAASEYGAWVAVLRISFVTLVAGGGFLLLLLLIAQRFSLFGTLSIFGVVLGVAALVVVQSVATGFQHEFERRVLGVYSHINVTRQYGLPEYRRFETWLRDMDGVEGASPFVYYAMALAPDDPSGERDGDIRLASVLVKGIEPSTAPEVIDIVDHLAKGADNADVSGLRSDLTLMPVLDRPNAQLPPPVAAVHDPRGEDWYPEAMDTWEAQRRERPDDGIGLGHDPGADTWVDPPVPGGKGPDRDPAAADGDEDRPALQTPTMFVGKSLAKELSLEVGDTVRLVDPGATYDHAEEPKFRHYEIAGVFEAGFQEYDSRLVYVHIKELQHFKFRGKDIVSGVDLRLRDPAMAARIGARIRTQLGDPANNQVLEWHKLNENLFNSIRTQKNAISVVLSLVMFVASFNVLAALWTMVMRRTPEVAIVMSMGGTGPQVARAFQLTGMTIGLAGSVAGVIYGLMLCQLVQLYGYTLDPEVYFIESLPVEVSFVQIAWILGLALSICFVATIPPALHAAWLRPVEGLRYE